MDKKIIIAIVLAVVIVGSAAAYVAYDKMTYEKKTVEIFENGTTMVVPATLELTNRSDMSVNFDDKENTTHIVGFRYDDDSTYLNLNAFTEAVVDSAVHNLTDKADLQDNGVFKLTADERKKMAAQMGTNTKDKDNVSDLYIGILKNDTLNQTIIIASENEQYVEDMMNTVIWKKPLKVSEDAETSTESKTTKTDEEVDNETEDTLTESDVSTDNNEADYSDEEYDDSSYEEDEYDDSYYEDKEVNYGGEPLSYK